MSLKKFINILILTNLFNIINGFKHYEYYNNKNCNKQVNKKVCPFTNNNKNYNDIDSYKKYIDSLNIDELYIKLSKIYKIDVLYLELLGITEGYSYKDLKNINKDFSKFNNRYIKILNYIRSIFIYYNLLKNSNKIYKYYDFEFSNILLDINKKIKITELSKLPSYNINIIDLLCW